MISDRQSLEDWSDFAVEIATEAGDLSKRWFKLDPEVERKEDNSPVTVADRECERVMRRRIVRRYSDHGIVGEEFGIERGDARYCWYLDPIDGTVSYIHGIPLYTILVALVEAGEPLVGVIHNPVLEETVVAYRGGGCRYRGNRCRVSDCTRLEQARLQVSDVTTLARQLPDAAGEIFRTVGTTHTWADAYGYLMVATGRADIALDPIMKPWDIAPLYPIITEAGGVVTDLSGSPSPLGESIVACSTPKLHQLMSGIIHPSNCTERI